MSDRNYKCPKCSGEFNNPEWTPEVIIPISIRSFAVCPFCGIVMQGFNTPAKGE